MSVFWWVELDFFSLECKSPHDSGSAFGTKCEGTAAAVFESIHFLLDNFGFGTQTALENLGKFEYWGPDFAVAVKIEYPPCGVLNGAPDCCFCGEDIPGSRRGL